MMKFKNMTGEAKRVRLDDLKSPSKYDWKTIYPGKTVNLPKNYGFNIRFTPVVPEDEKDGAKKEADKKDPLAKKEAEDFEETLLKLDGIGPKTCKDIMKIYPSIEILKTALKGKEEIPIRDDCIDVLKKGLLGDDGGNKDK